MSGQLGGAAGAIGNLGNFKSLFSFGENNGQIDKSETTVNVPKDHEGPIYISGAEFGDNTTSQTVAQNRDANASQAAGNSAAGEGSSGGGGGGDLSGLFGGGKTTKAV
jgi:hypothetical protein